MPTTEILDLLRSYNQAYADGAPVIDDQEYDAFIIENDLGSYPSGYGVSMVNKVNLPVPVFGMNKMQKPNEFKRLIAPVKHVIISEKLDGVSLLLDTRGNIPHAYTKGNADDQTGQRVDWIIPYLGEIMKHKGVFRGEVIVSKKNYPHVKAVKNIGNPLLFVSSYINSSNSGRDMSLAKYLDYKVFEIIELEGIASPTCSVSPFRQFVWLDLNGIGAPNWDKYASNGMEYNDLRDIFKEYSAASDYIIDGIIIARDEQYTRDITGDPKYTKAFKDIERNIVTVTEVTWQKSERGLLKPIVHIEPVTLLDETYTKLTGKNAKEIYNKNIGPGARIFYGINVVPVMYGVETPAAAPDMPDIPFKWVRGVEIAIIDADSDETVIAKKLSKFFDVMGVQGIKALTAAKLVAADICSPSVFLATDPTVLDGILGVLAGKATQSLIEKLAVADETQLMEASRVFPNLGRAKLQDIVSTGVDVASILELIYSGIPPPKPDGLGGSASWEVFVANLEDYADWRASLEGYIPEYEPAASTTAELAAITPGEGVVKYILTGKAPNGVTKAQFKALLPEGYVEVSTVNKADIVIGNTSTTSTKLTEARSKGKIIVDYVDHM